MTMRASSYPVSLGHLGVSLLYGLGVATTAALASLLGVVLSGPVIGMGERFEGIGLAWLFSLPFLVLGGIGSMVLYPQYRRRQTWWSAAILYLGNVIAVLLLAAMALMASGWLSSSVRRSGVSQPNYGVQLSVGAPSIQAWLPIRQLRAACS